VARCVTCLPAGSWRSQPRRNWWCWAVAAAVDTPGCPMAALGGAASVIHTALTGINREGRRNDKC